MDRDRHFASDDRLVGVSVPARCIADLVARCGRAATSETGGVLLGRYSEHGDRAIVSVTTGAPRDSIAGRWSFLRGVRGVQKVIDRAWRRGDYYLGEWHYHPLGSPQPSSTDIDQMRIFADDVDYRCPEPVLIVVGGDPAAEWTISVTVLISGSVAALHEVSGSNGAD